MERFLANKAGKVPLIRNLQRLLDAMDKETPNGMLVHWLEDAFEDGSFIMKRNGPDGTEFFKGQFIVDSETGDVEIDGDFTEVREERNFVDLKETNNTKVVNTEQEETGMEKEGLIKALMESDKTHFNESHKELLEGMDVAVLEAMQPKVEVPEGAETRNMFGFVHFKDKATGKWIRAD